MKSTMGPTEFKALRFQLGMSQTEMARALGVGLRTIVHYEMGDRGIPEPIVLLVERMIDDANLRPGERIQHKIVKRRANR